MSRDSFRFVHATSLCLDEPLVGTGPLNNSARELAEQSTLSAWEGIVSTAIDAQAEFVLLTGNCFDTRTESLRARVALEKGFETLESQGISVFIAPGNLDPLSAWKRNLTLSANVTILADEEQEPIAVLKDGRVIASVFVIAMPESDETRWSASGPVIMNGHQASYRIGIVPAGTPVRWEHDRPVALDQPGVSHAALTLVQSAIEKQVEYIALGEGNPGTYKYPGGIANDPGPSQSLSKKVTGCCGCSVIDVSSNGETRIDRIAVSAIRWEETGIAVDGHTNWEDLVERMALVVMELEPDNDEKLWILNWKITGAGKVFDALGEYAKRNELWELLEAELNGESAIQRVHRLERVTRIQIDPEESERAIGLIHDFNMILLESKDSLIASVKQEMLELDWVQQANAAVIREGIQQTPPKELIRRSQALAAGWLN